MDSERDLKRRTKEFLTGIAHLWFWMPVPTGYGIRGIPDFVGCWRGRFFGIETKAPNGKQSTWQKIIGDKIVECGGMYVLAFSIKDVENAFLAEAQSMRIRNPNAGAFNPRYPFGENN